MVDVNGSKRLVCAIDVVAGVLPGTPMPDFTRRYFITSEDWNSGKEQGQMLAEMNGKAQGYAGMLMLAPQSVNWVKTEWVWF